MKRGRYIPPSRKRRSRRIFLRLVAVLLIIAVLAVAVDKKLYPVVKDFAVTKAQIFANTTINEAVSDYMEAENLSYSDIIIVSRNSEGRVDSAEANTVLINKIKTAVVARVREKIPDEEYSYISIPLGSLSGSSYLSGRGPAIRVKVKLASNVRVDFESCFTDAGINQTLHSINIKVTSNVYILLPYSSCSATFSTDYLIGQSVIVGAVPDAYTNVIEIGNDGEGLDNIIMDYGAEK